MNAVIAAVGIMLILSLCRVHVVVALIVGALAGGLLGGLGVEGTLQAFNQGLGGGATVALSYALLGAFAVAIAKSGLAHALADKALTLVERQGGALASLDITSLGGRDGSPDHLNLLTLHSAKGCEYDVVIMVGLDLGNLPWRNETPEKLRESRRLFYVGLTRARDEVHMLYSGFVDGRYGPMRFGRSPFLDELEARMRAAGI